VGVLFPSEQAPNENYRIGQRLKVYLAKVEASSKGPGITLSRIHGDMVRRLFELEVPEIFAGTVEIKSIAREAESAPRLQFSVKKALIRSDHAWDKKAHVCRP
jgi:N utilization substance protein A